MQSPAVICDGHKFPEKTLAVYRFGDGLPPTREGNAVDYIGSNNGVINDVCMSYNGTTAYSEITPTFNPFVGSDVQAFVFEGIIREAGGYKCLLEWRPPAGGGLYWLGIWPCYEGGTLIHAPAHTAARFANLQQVPLNQWCRLAFVVDGPAQTLSIWCNGELWDRAENIGPAMPPTNNTIENQLIGGRWSSVFERALAHDASLYAVAGLDEFTAADAAAINADPGKWCRENINASNGEYWLLNEGSGDKAIGRVAGRSINHHGPTHSAVQRGQGWIRATDKINFTGWIDPAADASFTVANGSKFRVGDMVNPAGSGEMMLVANVLGNLITVTRGYLNTTPAPLVDGQELRIQGDSFAGGWRYFAGDSFATASMDNLTGDATVVIKFRPSAAGSGLQPILAKGSFTTQQVYLDLYDSPKRIRWVIGDMPLRHFEYDWQAGVEYTIVLLKIGNMAYLYVNGVQVDSAVSGDFVANSDPLYIGTRPGEAYKFTGDIGDCLICGQALSPAEIQKLSNGVI